MAVAPVRLTSGSAAAVSPAVQSAPIAAHAPRFLAGQAIPPLGPASWREPQALRLFRVPFHRVDPRSRGRLSHGLGE
jgi:hypothetical protein